MLFRSYAASPHKFVDHMQHAVFIVGFGDIIRCLKDGRLGICHGDAKPGGFYHSQVIVSVSAADHLVRSHADPAQETQQRMCFVNSPRHDLQEERIRAVYGQIRMKIFCDLVFCQVDDLRRAGEQDLVHGFRDMGWEILHMYDRHLIDPCLQFTVLVRVQPGDQIVRRVGQDIHSGIFPGYIEDRFCGVVGKRLFIDDLAGPAVGDPSSVEGQDITAEFVQMKLFCKGQDAFCRASACQNDFLALPLYIDQCVACGAGDFFVGICKGAVQVQHKHLIIHMITPVICVKMPSRRL